MKKRLSTKELIDYRVKRINETIGGNKEIQEIWYCLKDIVDAINTVDKDGDIGVVL